MVSRAELSYNSCMVFYCYRFFLASRPGWTSEAWRLVCGYISQSRPYLSHTLIAHEGVAPLRVTRLSMVKPSGATACIWSCGLDLPFAPLSVFASCTPYLVSTRKIIIAVRFLMLLFTLLCIYPSYARHISRGRNRLILKLSVS